MTGKRRIHVSTMDPGGARDEIQKALGPPLLPGLAAVPVGPGGRRLSLPVKATLSYAWQLRDCGVPLKHMSPLPPPQTDRAFFREEVESAKAVARLRGEPVFVCEEAVFFRSRKLRADFRLAYRAG